MPENVIDELVSVNPVIKDVSQLPVDIVMVAEPAVRVEPAVDVRLLAPKIAVALDSVNVPDHTKELPKVVLIALLTVKLLAVSSIEIVPPETLTTTVDVPTV